MRRFNRLLGAACLTVVLSPWPADADPVDLTIVFDESGSISSLIGDLTSSLGSLSEVAVPAPSGALIFVIGVAAALRRRRLSR